MTTKKAAPTKKKTAPTKKKVAATTTAETNAKVAELLKKMLPKLCDDQFETLCEDGQDALVQIAALLGVKADAFAKPREVSVDIDSLYMEIPTSYRGDIGNWLDYEAKITVLHRPSGTKYESDIDVTNVDLC